jgi:hypothetical protein
MSEVDSSGNKYDFPAEQGAKLERIHAYAFDRRIRGGTSESNPRTGLLAAGGATLDEIREGAL